MTLVAWAFLASWVSTVIFYRRLIRIMSRDADAMGKLIFMYINELRKTKGIPPIEETNFRNFWPKR